MKHLSVRQLLVTFILRTGYFPFTWKTSKTLMLLKPQILPHPIASYHPIQLTFTLRKSLETTFVKRLHQQYNLLTLYQASFRPFFCVDDQLLRLTNAISNHFNTLDPSCIVLLDLEKAFDNVWHTTLLWKLQHFRLPITVIRCVLNFWINRIAFICINSSTSHPVFLYCGVRRD